MSPCLITRRYLFHPAIEGGKQVSADHYKVPCDSHSSSFDRSDNGAGVGIAYMTLDQGILDQTLTRGDLPVAVRIFHAPLGKECKMKGDKGQSKIR